MSNVASASSSISAAAAATAQSSSPASTMSPAHPLTDLSPSQQAKVMTQMIQRERKRFSKLRIQSPVVGAPARIFKLIWDVRPTDTGRLFKYWNHQTALKRFFQLTSVVDMKRIHRHCSAETEWRRTQLHLTVWNLEERVQEHLARYPAVLMPHGWHAPPLTITIADLLPLTMSEIMTLHRKSARKLNEFCIKQMQPFVVLFQQAAILSIKEKLEEIPRD